MRRHEKRAVGRGGAGNLQRKKNATAVPKEFGFPGAQVGSKLFKTVTRSSRNSSERSVIDISRTGEIALRLLLLGTWQPDSTQDLQQIVTLTFGRLRTRP